MVTNTIPDEVLSELVEAEQAEQAKMAQQAALERTVVRDGESIGGTADLGAVKPMTLTVPESDKAAWVMAWELRLDRDGHEYGTPVRLPRNAIANYLQKRRDDGGKRFTVRTPARLAADPQYECFAHESCRKKVNTRALLIQHIYACHAQEALIYKPFIDQLQEAIIRDNPRLAKIVGEIATRPETGSLSVPSVQAGEIAEEDIDEEAGAPQVSTFGLNPYAEFNCDECDWKPREETTRKEFALTLHKRNAHKESTDVSQ